MSSVIQRVEAYDHLKLTTPLSLPKCSTIGKSVAKWTYQRFTEKDWLGWVPKTHSSETQAVRARQSKRKAVSDSERTLRPWEALGISRRSYF
nr:hypothetical protein [Klebsiella pneumoniae]